MFNQKEKHMGAEQVSFSAREQVLFSLPLDRLEPIFKCWVREVFRETSQRQESSMPLPEKLSKDQALAFLAENGIPTTTGNLYKMSAKNEIPCARIGKRLIFSRIDLLNWIESRSVRKTDSIEKTAMQVSKSANNHLGRKHKA